MAERDAQRAQAFSLPEGVRAQTPEAYAAASLEQIIAYAGAQFRYWAEDDFAAAFRRLLTLEQYRSAEMAELYNSCLAAGPVAYMEDIFREMRKKGLLREADPKQLALAYYAPLYLLINMWDRADDKAALTALLDDHIARFIQNASRTVQK